MRSEIQSDSDSVFGDVIYSYSRKQALLDGVLVDLSDLEIIREHWKIPMACTSAVWDIITDAIDNGSCDIAGILHDVSCLAKRQIGRNSGDRLYFKCQIGLQTVDLQLVCGPGDNPMPVLTLMMINED